MAFDIQGLIIYNWLFYFSIVLTVVRVCLKQIVQRIDYIIHSFIDIFTYEIA